MAKLLGSIVRLIVILQLQTVDLELLTYSSNLESR